MIKAGRLVDALSNSSTGLSAFSLIENNLRRAKIYSSHLRSHMKYDPQFFGVDNQVWTGKIPGLIDYFFFFDTLTLRHREGWWAWETRTGFQFASESTPEPSFSVQETNYQNCETARVVRMCWLRNPKAKSNRWSEVSQGPSINNLSQLTWIFCEEDFQRLWSQTWRIFTIGILRCLVNFY